MRDRNQKTRMRIWRVAGTLSILLGSVVSFEVCAENPNGNGVQLLSVTTDLWSADSVMNGTGTQAGISASFDGPITSLNGQNLYVSFQRPAHPVEMAGPTPIRTPTTLPFPDKTMTPSATPVPTVTPTETCTTTQIPTLTQTPTVRETVNFTPSSTGTPTFSPTETRVPSPSPTLSPSFTPSIYLTPMRIDGDRDGIPNVVEDGGPNDGDSNGDGIADSFQPGVVTFRNAVDGRYLSLIAPPDTEIKEVVAMAASSDQNPLPQGVVAPYGLIHFALEGISSKAPFMLTLVLPDEAEDLVCWKYGDTMDTASPHWYSFDYDGVTGVQVNGQIVTFWFLDDGRGDDDLTGNKILVDLVAPLAEKSSAVKNWIQYR